MAPPNIYENLHWYPGRTETEEQKKMWMMEHPNIHEVTGTEFAQSDL
jgi:hypothetical protein